MIKKIKIKKVGIYVSMKKGRRVALSSSSPLVAPHLMLPLLFSPYFFFTFSFHFFYYYYALFFCAIIGTT